MSKRFRIAFSFAGEKRDFVSKVAAIMAKQFGEDKILYDKFHEAEFAVYDLGIKLPKLYGEQSDLIVPVLCNAYDSKRWTGWEWVHIYSLLTKEEGNRVMPSRFDYAIADGLSPASGFIELDDKTPEQFAALILERLAINEGYPKEYYFRDTPEGPGWPAVAPSLDWPVADHTEAQKAFAELVTRTSTFRFLPIRGNSETGKSHLTKQFLGNAFKIPNLTFGRFDFKGSSDMDTELQTFAERLAVTAPTPKTGLSSQLSQVFASLKKAASPTLLIFDTFELAGEGERWVKENLLLSIVRDPWLRVIIVGQRVPNKYGEPWAGITSDLIELRPPTPQEWFDFGKPHHDSPEFTIEFVRSVHATVKGKSSVLAQVCGPAG